MSDILRLNKKQQQKVSALVKNKCCNYVDGGCILLDWPFCNTCPQAISYSVNCRWFREAVLPADPTLEASIVDFDSKRACEICGNNLRSSDPRTRFCHDCAQKRIREQKLAWAKKNRAHM